MGRHTGTKRMDSLRNGYMLLGEYLMIDTETRNRIMLSVYAYAYEFMNDSLIDDEQFDSLAKQIKPTVRTGNKKIDDFFAKEFVADSGMWIRKHPELDKLNNLYNKYYKGKV